MTKQEILDHLEKNKNAWIKLPSAIKDENGKPEFEMLLATSGMTDPGTASLYFRETFTGGFEYASRAFIHAHLQPGDTFIDVGAHFGLYSLTAACKFPGQVKVLSVEPHPANIKMLRMWADFNECANSITAVECAASDHSGFSLLNQNSSMGHSLMSSPHSPATAEPLNVALEPLDKLAERAGLLDSESRIFLKIDTEGHELQALTGALNLLKSGRVAAVIWEKGHYHNTEKGLKDFAQIRPLLRDLGYDSYRFPHEDMGGPLVPYTPSHESCNIISMDRSLKKLPVYEKPWTAHPVMPSSMRPKVSPDFMIGYTNLLMEDKSTDCGRWSRWNSLGHEADLRAGIAGRFVPENSTVLDTGAGLMMLRDYIPENCTYIPLDIVARNRNCIVADLNQKQYPKEKYDVVTALFLLEFLHDPGHFLKWAHKTTKRLIFTYYPLHNESAAQRRAAGFFNDLTLEGIKRAVISAGWKIRTIAGVSQGQMLFDCIKEE